MYQYLQYKQQLNSSSNIDYKNITLNRLKEEKSLSLIP